MMKENEKKAVLLSAEPPSREQEERFLSFLRKKYGEEVTLEWQKNLKYPGGFQLVIGSEVYDWSADGRFTQLKNTLSALKAENDALIPLLRETLQNWVPQALSHEVGTVLTVGDGIATVEGLKDAEYGEILLFSSGTRGMVMELDRDEIGCILFDDTDSVSEGSAVYRTRRTAGMPVGEAFLGRVVDALGTPIDGGGAIPSEDYFPIERPAPGIPDRQPVNVPLETGILAIDSMFPIGRGQRELIIGDRKTGKTAIALDTIVNQKGKNVICIYVAIGQKAGSVAKIVEDLRRRSAMEYTAVLCASASDPAPMQYIAPYAGCALGEYFMNRGKDVLIVYDDLSKHAVAYRSISLLLGRSPGREAYPGDVFYLHSRLLERSAHLSDALGGGSMTALPIAETQSGDVSAYIPTNIISITDGQLFLETDLFFAGQRPAVNVGLSVSRVGGDAQTRAMKAAAGPLRLVLAQYREMKVFTQFSSDLDEDTKRRLSYGGTLMELLKQDRFSPLSGVEQVLCLTAALNHAMDAIPHEKLHDFCRALCAALSENDPSLCGIIAHGTRLSDEENERIVAAAKALSERFTSPTGR